MKISIIVPIYNAEWRIRLCLDSIKSQTYGDFEVILVDDGSTDSSPAICDEYAQHDTRFIAVHKVNGGVSSARNEGLKKATGEWVAFVDADDTLEPDMYEKMIDVTKKNRNISHIVQGFCKGNNKVIFPNGILGRFETFQLLNETPFCCCGYLWHRLYRREHLKGLEFDTHLSFGEDGVFWYYYLCRIEQIAFIDSIGYHYFIDAQHQSLTGKNIEYEYIKYMVNKFCDAFKVLEKKDSRFSQYLTRYMIIKLMHYAYRGITANEKDKSVYFKKMQHYVNCNPYTQKISGINWFQHMVYKQLKNGHEDLFRILYRLYLVARKIKVV